MANRLAVPIFSTSKVDSCDFSSKKCPRNTSSHTPRKTPLKISERKILTPLTNNTNDHCFETPTSLNSSRQRWKSASAVNDMTTPKNSKNTSNERKLHICSPSLSPKSGRSQIQRFYSENSVNSSIQFDTSITSPLTPNGEASNFVVGVRVRPFTLREEKDKSVRNVVSMTENEVSLTCASGTIHSFLYDHCFYSFSSQNKNYASQSNVFSTMVEPLLDQVLLGYNACLLAYGQTGSGKSYSMMGLDNGFNRINEEAGVIPRFCHLLFDRAANSEHEICIEISFYEIYNEKIHDLLASHTEKIRPALKVREHPTLGPYVVDLAVHSVTSFNDVKGWLTVGNSHRITAATGVNEKSSRSHSIFSILVTQRREGVTSRSRANLVDLAGSERVAQSAATGNQLKEGVSINKSLLSLGKVITFLSERSKRRANGTSFGPYRESVLTWLLKESLGGNSKTAMLATISPANVHLDETLATLRYACQARSIVNRVHPNEDPNERIIRELRMEHEKVAALRAELENMRKLAEMSNKDQSTAKQTEIDDLKRLLKDAETKVAQDQKPWEEKVQRASERKCAELQYLRGCGVTLETIDCSHPCLVTLSADPILSGTLMYGLPPGIKSVGSGARADIILHSPLIAHLHCHIENVNGRLWLRPQEREESFVNGVAVTRDTELLHGDRLSIGGAHFFRVKINQAENTSNACADFEQAQRELKREQELRLRNDLRAELDEVHTQERNNMIALIDQQNIALQNARQMKSALEAERNDLQAMVSNQDADTIPSLSPFRSTFCEGLRAIFAPHQRSGGLSLLETHLLVREATQRCREHAIGLEFFQEQVQTDCGLEPVVRIFNKDKEMSGILQQRQFLDFLESIRDQDNKEQILNTVNTINIKWEAANKMTRPTRRISVKRRKSSNRSENDNDLCNAVSFTLEEMQRHLDKLVNASKDDSTLNTQIEQALPHFQAFVDALSVSTAISNKTVSFASTTYDY